MHERQHGTLRAGFAALVLLLTLGDAAQAQYAFDDEIMPPRAVAWRLADRGFTGIGRPRFDGRAYVVEATAPAGARLRLFIDATDGAILGRQRLDPPPMASGRPMPGYGWTEEDDVPRRPMRQAERLVPPADIPMPESRFVPQGRSDGSVVSSGRMPIDPNPQGLNPEMGGRAEAPRKVARVGTPAKLHESRGPARVAPEAPKAKPVEAAKPESKPEAPVATVEPPKPASEPSATRAVTPAAVQPLSDKAEAAPEKPPAQTWKDPPEGRRNVRVIGGATVVPGTSEKEPGATP